MGSVVVGKRQSRNTDYSEHFVVSEFYQKRRSGAFNFSSMADCLPKNSDKCYASSCEKTEVLLAFEKALDNGNVASKKSLRFTVSPGKMVFIGRSGYGNIQLSKQELLADSDIYLRQMKLKSFYVPNLKPDNYEILRRKLEKLGFEDINAQNPDSYTVVHMDVNRNSESVHYSVTIAVDKELNSHQQASDDFRLSAEKKTAIDKVLGAKSIGEVFPGVEQSKLKMSYLKQTRLLHPDKNLHAGAADAFKVLKDAYEKLTDGSRPSEPVIRVESSISFGSSGSRDSKPPKVIEVRSNKLRLCTLTTVGDNDFDLRGSLVGFEEEDVNLSNEVRDIVNKCWDERGASGKLPMSSGGSLFIQSVKQAVEIHNWFKEIQFEGRSQMLQVKVKKLRLKQRMEMDWESAVEVDFKFPTDPQNKNCTKFTAKQLTREFLVLKEWADKLMSN